MPCADLCPSFSFLIMFVKKFSTTWNEKQSRRSLPFCRNWRKWCAKVNLSPLRKFLTHSDSFVEFYDSKTIYKHLFKTVHHFLLAYDSKPLFSYIRCSAPKGGSCGPYLWQRAHPSNKISSPLPGRAHFPTLSYEIDTMDVTSSGSLLPIINRWKTR